MCFLAVCRWGMHVSTDFANWSPTHEYHDSRPVFPSLGPYFRHEFGRPVEEGPFAERPVLLDMPCFTGCGSSYEFPSRTNPLHLQQRWEVQCINMSRRQEFVTHQYFSSSSFEIKWNMFLAEVLVSLFLSVWPKANFQLDAVAALHHLWTNLAKLPSAALTSIKCLRLLHKTHNYNVNRRFGLCNSFSHKSYLILRQDINITTSRFLRDLGRNNGIITAVGTYTEGSTSISEKRKPTTRLA